MQGLGLRDYARLVFSELYGVLGKVQLRACV